LPAVEGGRDSNEPSPVEHPGRRQYDTFGVQSQIGALFGEDAAGPPCVILIERSSFARGVVPMKTKRALFLAVVLAGLMFSSIAAADVPPPGLQSCQGKIAGAACDMENYGGQPTGQQGVCGMAMACNSYVPCGPDASIPVCPDGGGPPGYVFQKTSCLICQATDAGSTDGAAGADGSDGSVDAANTSDAVVAAGGAAGATGGAAGTAGTVVAGGAAGTAGTVVAGGAAGTGGASGGAGAVALGGNAGAVGTGGSTGSGGSTAAGGTTITSAPPAEEGGGCSLGGTDAKKTFGPWLLSGAVAALLLLARRRRR
jgi:MYXO-CTERM domain-containing protein